MCVQVTSKSRDCKFFYIRGPNQSRRCTFQHRLITLGLLIYDFNPVGQYGRSEGKPMLTVIYNTNMSANDTI